MSDQPIDLTKRQRQVLDALARLSTDNGFAPTLREIASEVGLASASSVHHHVRVLEEAELVERRAGCPRAINQRVAHER
jgi:repressor LexA